ncbi:uncharacterized protein LOC123290876 [Chrysoperla carnea]|uniref:uncharacterized protein LOC123290876 n=1 Tax=Chrysoperla carnea TaxID=189513 RepID=UPI001D064CD8|nr:uncharacterized protein LOC123290876 [Chrysoperla carnea]
MLLKPLIVLSVILCTCNVSIFGLPNLPSLPPSVINLAMMKRLIKFYTLQSKSERSDLCAKQSKLLYDDVYKGQLWAERMIDSSAKLQSGITKLHLSDVGYFDECIQISHNTNDSMSINGKYCLANIEVNFKNNNLEDDIHKLVGFSQTMQRVKPNLLNEEVENNAGGMTGSSLSWAICVPDGCTAKEVEDHLNTFAGANMFTVKESKCHTIDNYKSKLNAGDWVVIAFLGILGVIILLSTIYDVFLYYTKAKPYHQIFIAFSWLTNFQKLVKISNNPEMLPCLNGVRFLSMLWIIYGHEHMSTFSNLVVNTIDIPSWSRKFFSTFTLGSSVSVDSFFLLSGCLLMYSFLKSQAKKVSFNVPLFYLHRYIRLTPSYAATIIFLVTLYRQMGSGPNWDPENSNEPCRKNWWAALLYIQNYVEGQACVMQSWYLQIDMQLYILSPLLLIPIAKWPKITPYILSSLVLVFVLIPAYVAWHYKLSASMFGGGGGGGANQMDVYYGQTYTRAGPWILGLLLGYILYKCKTERPKLDRIAVTLLWIVSCGAMLYTVLGIYPENQPGYEYDRVFNSIFVGAHRVVWSAGLSWIIFACIQGYGGPVNWILSLPMFQVLAKLTYSMYLTHIFMQNIHSRSLQMPYIFSNMHIWYSFCGTLITCLIVSLFWTLTFESPFIVLDTLLMKFISGLTSKKPAAKVQNKVEEKNDIEKEGEHKEQMIDASAKLPNGITKLHLSDVGYFDECIQVKNENKSIRGKYCLATFRNITNILGDKNLKEEIKIFEGLSMYLNSVMVQNLTEGDNSLSEVIKSNWAICVPDGCSALEVEEHLNAFFGIEIFMLDEINCQTIETYKSKLNTADWCVMKDPDMLLCLNGIRFLSMLWILLGHEYSNIIYQTTPLCVNLLDVKEWFSKFSSMFIIGSTVSVDSFLFLSGCLLMYGFLNLQNKNKSFNIPLFYLHRYLRLTPSYAAVIIFMVTLYRFMGSGPLWDPENTFEPCRTNWWAALLYIQNYVAGLNRCVGQSWYLQIDMQLYILSPLLLLPIIKWPRQAPFILLTLMFILIIIPFGVAWHYKLAAFIDLRGEAIGNADIMTVYYFQTYTRAGPWVMGMLLGYILIYNKNKKVNLSKNRIILLWIVSITAMMYVVFGFYDETKPGYEYDRVFNSLFIGLHRVIWSAGLSWIIFACIHGFGGPINWILSLPVFQVLSRLTYSMYLTHVFVQQIHHKSLQMPFLFSNSYAWYSFCGTLVNVMVISLIWTLTFESPFVVLDTLLKNYFSELFEKKSHAKVKRIENVSSESKL